MGDNCQEPNIDKKTAKEILDAVDYKTDLKNQFENLRPSIHFGRIRFVVLTIIFIVVFSQMEGVVKEYPEMAFIIIVPFLILLGIIGSESRRIHKRLDIIEKIISSKESKE